MNSRILKIVEIVFVKKLNKSRGNIKFSRTQIIVLVLVLFLVGFGCLMVYSASSYAAAHRYHNQYYFLIKQIIGAVIGAMCLALFSFVDYHKFICHHCGFGCSHGLGFCSGNWG